MGLTDRLAAAQRARTESPDALAGERPPPRPLLARRQAAAKAATRDPFEDVKRVVHAQLVASLGPEALRRAHDAERAGEQRPPRAPRSGRGDAMSSCRGRPHPHHPGDLRRHPGLRPAWSRSLRDGDLSEVMVNAYDSIYVERNGKLVKTGTGFSDEAHLRRTIDKIVGKIGRRVDEASPMVDARLPDGRRVNAIIPPLALDGSKLTIRKFSEDPYTVQDLINFGSLTQNSAEPARGLRQGPAQHPGLRRHRRRQDDHPQRAVLVHPRRRAHRHHRGRRRAPARSGPRPPPGVPTAQHRGQGRRA